MKPNGNTIRRISPIHLKEPKQKGLTAFADQEREKGLTKKEELDYPIGLKTHRKGGAGLESVERRL
jgi:hypothetical protein